MLLLNAFSLNMVAEFPASFSVEEISLSLVREILKDLGLESAVGHEDTASLFGQMLGMPVGYNRVNNSLAKGDSVIVGQYRGPRLPEGASELPEGATIKWLRVTVE